jgi:hypothetical protein
MHRPGDKVEVTLLRGKKEKTFDVTLKNMQGNTEVVKKFDLTMLGAAFKPISDDVKRHLGVSYGLEVAGVEKGKFAEAGIKTTDSVTKQDVNAYVDSIIKALGGEEEYKAYLAECYMTDAVVRFNNALDSCVYRYFEKISEEWDKEAYDAVMAKDGFIRTRSIFVRNDDGESVAENRKTAERVLSEIKGGKPLTSFIGKKENQDYGSCDYYFMKGYFEEEYEEAAFALEVGEVSEVVETDGGFYIIERVEPDDGYFLDNLNALKSIYVECKMYEVINEAADRIEFEFNDYGKTIDLWTME